VPPRGKHSRAAITRSTLAHQFGRAVRIRRPPGRRAIRGAGQSKGNTTVVEQTRPAKRRVPRTWWPVGKLLAGARELKKRGRRNHWRRWAALERADNADLGRPGDLRNAAAPGFVSNSTQLATAPTGPPPKSWHRRRPPFQLPLGARIRLSTIKPPFSTR